MKTGYFNERGDEFSVENYKLRRPILNYFWNDKFLAGVNNLGSGVGAYRGNTSFFFGLYGKPRAQMISNGSRYFYIQDNSTGKLWNPGWYPVKEELDSYKCTHGLGYTVVSGTKDDLKVTITGTVDSTEACELWQVKLENLSGSKKSVTVFPYVEFSLEGYVNTSEYDSWVRAYYYEDENMIFANNNSEERPHPFYHGYCATDIKASAYDTSKDKFLGTYGSIEYPEAIKNGGLTNSLAACERMVGAFENQLDIAANGATTFHFVVGLTDSVENAKAVVKKVLVNGYFEENLKLVNARKEELASQMEFYSPDKKINDLANFWLKQQVQLCVEVGRGAGKGFRDQLQDSWAIASFDKKVARDKIYETLEQIYHTGRCVRGWLPLKDRNMCDGPGWVGNTISAYLKETGDFDFLNEKVKYLDEGVDTVWEHLITTMRYSSDDIGAHGIVLAHEGDWNDSLNGMGRAGIGESVWASIALYSALNETAKIAREIMKDSAIETEMLDRAKRIKAAVEEYGWDGEWYLAGYSDKGNKVGSHEEKEGMIYLNMQTWAAITGLAEGERLKKCIESADKYLDSDYGPITLYPAYTSYNPEIGRLTGFVPGIWENGTPYCHGSAFKIISDCVLGRGDQAYESLLKITPDSDWNPTSHSGCEPYAYTNMYFGPDNPRKGETAFSWITGTAGWVYRCVSQYMLGFHPEFDGFVVDPCIPSAWRMLKGVRKFRNDTYRIEIENPDGNTKGVKKLFVDDKECSDNYVPLFGDGKVHTIKVVL